MRDKLKSVAICQFAGGREPLGPKASRVGGLNKQNGRRSARFAYLAKASARNQGAASVFSQFFGRTASSRFEVNFQEPSPTW